MVDFVNKFTGEVKKRDFGSPIWSPVVDFEEYEPGTSMTAPDQVEPLQTIIARCMRGELLNISKKESIEDDISDAELSILDGTADLADIPSLVSAAVAADGANSGVEPQSGVDSESAASASDSATSGPKTESAGPSESKGQGVRERLL